MFMRGCVVYFEPNTLTIRYNSFETIYSKPDSFSISQNYMTIFIENKVCELNCENIKT